METKSSRNLILALFEKPAKFWVAVGEALSFLSESKYITEVIDKESNVSAVGKKKGKAHT